MRRILVVVILVVIVGCGADTDVVVQQAGTLPRYDDLKELGVNVYGNESNGTFGANCPIPTDEGLARLNELTNIRKLEFGGGGAFNPDAGVHESLVISDAGFEHIGKLTSLEDLRIGGDEISDVGLEHIENLTNLRRLNLSSDNITGAGMEHIKKLRNLTSLHLGGSNIGDDGLEHIGSLTKLQWFTLRSDQITDKGLEHLKGLKNLNNMYLTSPKVTRAGVEELVYALPNKCFIRVHAEGQLSPWSFSR